MITTNDSLATDDRRSQTLAQVVMPCLEGFHGRLLALFDAFYDRIDDALLAAADKAENRGPQVGYAGVTRQFHHRQISRSAFHRSLREAAAQLLSTEPRGPVLGTPAAGPQEIEERLAIKNLVSKSTSRYQDVLLALSEHISGLTGGEPLAPAANPIGPTVICQALRAAIEPIAELDPPVRLIVYKLFDRQVMDHLDGLYSACLQCFSATGDRPAGDVCQTTTSAGDAAPPPTRRQPAPQAISFRVLQQALGPGLPPRRSDDNRAIDTDELMRILSGIQRGASPVTVPTTVLRAQLGTTLGRSLGEVDETTLDLVFLLFEHLLADSMLPDAIKVLIARLQIPVLKVALLDKSFFDDPDHPARRLLNRMAQAAMGWTDDGDRSPEGLYGRLERIVERIIGDFGQDLALFAELDAGLCAEFAAEDEPARIRERRIRQLAEERAQASTTAQVVAATIGARLRRYRQVPPVVRELLETGWAEVLATTHVLEGPDRQAWGDQVALIDRLLWSICPKRTPEERRELLRGIPTLLHQLRLGLADTMLDSRQIARWLRDLQVLHLAALRGDGSTVTPAEGAASPDEDLARRPIIAEAAPPNTGVPVALALGTWIALRRDGAAPVRLKLVWQGRDGALHLFIDGQGRRTVELECERLATLLAVGAAEIIGHEDEAIVDRAVTALMRSVQH